MVFVGDVDLTQFWLATAIGLYLLAVILGIFVYSPTLRSQIRVVEADGVETEEFRRLSSRGAIVGGILAAIVVTIVFLMVTKPVL
jgi:uncharacterized membrane protein